MVLALALGMICSLASPAPAQEFPTIDPSGVWKGPHGVLSLMLAGDALSFTYSAVFGATAHLCDGVGVAGLVSPGEYHYVDEQGSVAFLVTEPGVRMQTVQGVPSFCGAHWPGETFTRAGFEAPARCRVSEPRAFFHVVMRPPLVRRQGYVVRGDQVEVVPAAFDGGDAWVLARFRGPGLATVGLLPKRALNCPP